ncbi:MAG: PqqD family protein [Ruminococcus sp.]|nr:PqqD family protein [Ruminococcus sp.]
MKLKDGFITHESAGEHITVTAGNTAFNGMIRSNGTAGFIIECLKDNVSKEDIITKMLEKYDAPREQIEKDADRILEQLHTIGAIDD